MLKLSRPVSFSLRDDYHEELGWADFVRDQASLEPAAIRGILAQRAHLALGHDPLTRLQRWAPWLPGFMFYWWFARAGDYTASFAASDAAFTMVFSPRPEDEHLLGLPDELEWLALEAWPERERPDRSPLMPSWPGAGPAPATILPLWLVVHRYPLARATLHPAEPTLRALATDPWAWCRAQPPLPGLYHA